VAQKQSRNNPRNGGLIMDASETMLGATKMFAHLDRLAIWQAGGLPPPVTVELDLTNACNDACPGCTFSYLVNIDKSSIPMERARSIVQQLGDFGVRAITFSGGGEPLVYGRERVLELMQQAVSLGMDVSLITNGSLLKPEHAERFLRVCTWIRVSLDAYNAETYQRYHGRGERAFATVCENLRALCAAKTDPSWATIGAGFLTDRKSIEQRDIWKFAEFCSKIPGLEYGQLRPLVNNMVADPSLTGGYEGFSQQEHSDILLAYREAREAFGRSDFKVVLSGGKYTALAQKDFGRTYSSCHAHFLEAVVGADSKVYICCHGQGIEAYCLGDLSEDSFQEVWESKRAKEVYESINPSSHCPPACRLHQQNALLQDLTEGVTHPNFI
jgi:radical SAM protein with 4Fe4S-binding SPASM domain